MFSIGFNVMTFCKIYWAWLQVSANGETFLLNVSIPWTESGRYCQGVGKAVFDVKEERSDAVLKSVLNKSNQAWVAATVELSDFIKQPVCMGTSGLQFKRVEHFTTNIIANCLKFCKGYRYIGLMDRDCICLEQARNLTRSILCDIMCNHDPVHLCGGNESISLYEKVDTLFTQKIAPGSKECVYARSTNNITDLITESCVWHLADGGMCEGGRDKECRAFGWTVLRKGLCRMDLDRPFRWKQTMRFCANIGGKLLSSEIPSSQMKNNLTYWLGFHRKATIHRVKDMQLSKNETYCAVARREEDVMLIEGEDCRSKHAVLCQDEDYSQIPASTGTYYPQTSWHTKTDNSTEIDTKITYAVVAVSVIILLAIFTALLICTIRRRKKLRHKEMRQTDCTSEHIDIPLRASTSHKCPFEREHDVTEPGQTPYENLVLVRNEQTLTVHQLGQSISAQPVYENLHIQGKHSKDEAIHLYGQITSQ